MLLEIIPGLHTGEIRAAQSYCPDITSLTLPIHEWLEENHATERELVLRLFKVHAKHRGIGYKEALARTNVPSNPFLKEEETPSGSALGLFAVRAIPNIDHVLYIVGGIRLDRSFLASLDLPAGMRVMFYENLNSVSDKFAPEHLITASDSSGDPQAIAPLIRQLGLG